MPTNDAVNTLDDLWERDLAGYEIAPGYYLELEHGLMGFFPAITTRDGEIVVCLARSQLSRVLKCLPARPARIGELFLLVNKSNGLAFNLSHPRERGKWLKPFLILSEKKLASLCARENSFAWSPGLL